MGLRAFGEIVSRTRRRLLFLMVLAVVLGGTPFAHGASQAAPSNDNFVNAQLLAGASGTTTGTNVEATAEDFEPDHDGEPVTHSVWYKITPATGTVTIDTFGSDFDTVLAVYTGTSVVNLTYVTSNDDDTSCACAQSAVTFDSVAGTTYRIAVDGFGGAVGSISLHWGFTVPPPPPSNDNFANATSLTGATGTKTGTNVSATAETGEPDHALVPTPSPAIHSVWYSLRPGAGTVTFDTFGSDFDTVLAVYTGTSVNSLTRVTSNDDDPLTTQSQVTFNAAAATTYWIAVDGFNGGSFAETGNILLHWKVPAPSLTINNVSHAEGNVGTTAFSFTVTLSAASTVTTAVYYEIVDGTATLADADYVSVLAPPNPASLVVFAAGQTSKTVMVLVNGDTKVEPTETFTVNLSAASGATIADGTGVGTITNDDAATLAVTDVSLAEGNVGTKAFTFTVSLSAASTAPVSVTVASANGTATTADSDYVAVPATLLTFAAGETSKTVTVQVNGDSTVEANETFTVNLSAASGATIADASGLGTIVNDDRSMLTCSALSLVTQEDTVGDVAPACTGADPTVLTYSIVSGASHGTASVVAGQLHYVPKANENGSDSFTYKATARSAESPAATVTVTIVPVNDVPRAVDDAGFSTDADLPFAIPTSALLANDTDPDGDPLSVTAAAATASTHGTVELDAELGEVIYTPDVTYSGPASFTYTIADPAGLTSTATVSLTVDPIADADCKVRGDGETGKHERFRIDAQLKRNREPRGFVNYNPRGVRFKSTRLTSIACVNKMATIVGVGVADHVEVTFTLIVTDGSPDQFAISWDGFSAGGPVTRGKIKVDGHS